VFAELADASTLKPEVVAGLDLMILRELTGGVYFGERAGVTTTADGTRRGVTRRSTPRPRSSASRASPSELARKRRNAVSSVEKANVMHTGVLWRETVTKLHAAEYGDVKLTHMYADNCAMQLVRNPKQFDVIVNRQSCSAKCSPTSPSQVTGSIGMLPSALARRRRRERPAQGALRADPRLGARHRRQGRSPTRWRRCSASRCCCATPSTRRTTPT
jgi:3-isopropylmalate dehydrogenase